MKSIHIFRWFALVALIFLLGSGCKAQAQTTAATAKPSPFTICSNQTYALCATASCFVYDQVAYCGCDVLSGNSITATDGFDDGQTACTVNASGVDNGYMVSLFSVPESVLPGGNEALYTCPASTSNGAYAQCDGGICFTSTQAKSFPGFTEPLADNQIICSCPITVANPATARKGYQIVGPYPCQKSFLENCRKKKANKQNGATIFVGAPAGVPRLLARQLEGSVPNFNTCP
ncbi:MAG TPA: hypothetical protein VMH37_13060 [Candidatus Binataceae bacterium]|nr:hypothetical protein [Candidatus Binataceae bacterium]